MRYNGMMLALSTIAVAGISLAVPDNVTGQAEAPRQFNGYNPGRCVVAGRVIDGINRHDRRDTTMFTPERDTLFSATTASIRECEQAYGRTTSEVTEVLNLARVQRLTGQDEAAISTTRQHLSSVSDRPDDERAWELYLISSDNMAGKPARLEQARAALDVLDRLGEAAASVRTMAHSAMMQVAIRRYEDDTMRREAAAVVTAWSELDDESRDWRLLALFNTMTGRAAVEALVNGREAALMVIDTARGIIRSSDAQSQARLRNVERMYRLLDQPAAPLEAQFWYNTGATGTTRPAPGRVSLILPIDRPCTGGCLDMLDGVRRLERKFRDQDLDITFRTRTLGFFADTAPASPLAEAQYDSAYFLHDVELPGALAIAETEFSWKADGRRMNAPTADDVNYPGARVVIVDRLGIIRYVSSVWSPVLEARVTDLIEQLLAEDVVVDVDGYP